MRLPTLLLLSFSLCGRLLAQAPTAEQMAELKRLFEPASRMAEELLMERREFHPFGAVLSKSGAVEFVAGYTGERPTSTKELMALVKAGLREKMKLSDATVCAFVYDVRTIPPGMNDKTDGIAVDLHHRDGLSVTLIVPYVLVGEHEIKVAKMFGVPAQEHLLSAEKTGEPAVPANPVDAPRN